MVYERMREFAEKLMPEHVERIQLHDGPRPLFHTYGVEQDFERIFARRIDLPSGGSIVIDQTEALVAIDVNSGQDAQRRLRLRGHRAARRTSRRCPRSPARSACATWAASS